MQLSKQTQQHQSALASYCRTGKLTTIPGINTNNIGQYRRLVFNIVDDMLQSAFPLSHELMKAKEWHKLVLDFFATHPCQSPQVWYMPKEFYEYMKQTGSNIHEKYPHLLELLWFEWLEVELFMMDDQPVDYTISGNINKDGLILNPEFQLQHFTFPVHLKKSAKITATDRGDYYLSIHRMPDSGDVSFTDLSPAFVRMLEILSSGPETAEQLIHKLCAEFQIPPTEEINSMCIAFIQTAITSRLIIGFQKN